MSTRLMDRAGFDVSEFILEVQMGHIPGASYTWQLGYSPVNTSTLQNTISNVGAGLYTYYLGYNELATKIDIVSSNPADNGLLVGVYGLDANGYEQREAVAIGTTSTKTWSRILKARNHNGILMQGIVTLYATTTLNKVAVLDIASQSSLMATFTVPKGKAGFLHKGSVSLGSGKEGTIDWMIKDYSHVFTIGERLTGYQNSVEATRPFIPIKERSDVEVRFTPTQNNTLISTSFGIILLDIERFGLESLKDDYSPI